MKKSFVLISMLLTAVTSNADLIFPNPEPIEIVDEVRLCKPNHNSTQMIVVRAHLNAIEEAIDCGDLDRAAKINKGLAIYLRDEVATTALGICYDDRRCQSAQSSKPVEKSTCKAANGKSWMQTSPSVGSCELVR